MSFEQAVAIRVFQLQGGWVHPLVLAEAIGVIQGTKRPALRAKNGEKRVRPPKAKAKHAADIDTIHRVEEQ